MTQKTVVVISSHVARGSVGLRACSLALEALGNCVASLPTTILSHHPGHGVPPRFSPSDEQFNDLLNGLCRPNWMNEFDAVICGYFASVAQVRAARDFYDKLTAAKDKGAIKLIVDPVIGDNGKLYIDQSIAEAIRDVLLPVADVITPNRFELEWLSGSEPFENNNDMLKAVNSLLSERGDEKTLALVTSAFSLMPNATGSLLCGNGKAWLAEHQHFLNAPNGLGDLTSAVFTHHLLQNAPPAAALEKTTASVVEILQRTLKDKKDELAIEANIGSLIRPFQRLQMRQIISK